MTDAEKALEMSFSIDEILDAITPEGRAVRVDITTEDADGATTGTVTLPIEPA